MSETPKWTTKKKVATLSGAILLAGVAATAILGGGDVTPVKNVIPMTEKQQVQWLEDFEKEVIHEHIPYAEAEAKLNQNVERLKGEAKAEAIDMMIYRGGEREQQLKALLSIVEEDLQAYDNRKEGEGLTDEFIEGIPDASVRGVLTTIKDSNFEVYKTLDGSYTASLDYKGLLKKYEDVLPEGAVFNLKLGVHAMDHEYYDTASGHALFDNMNSRYELMLDLLESGNEENAWLENSAYELYGFLLGYGDYGMNTEDGEYNKEAVEEMEKVIKVTKDEQLAKDMKTIIKLMEEEGSYTEEIEQKALQLRDERYKDFINKFGEEMDQPEEVDEFEIDLQDEEAADAND